MASCDDADPDLSLVHTISLIVTIQMLLLHFGVHLLMWMQLHLKTIWMLRCQMLWYLIRVFYFCTCNCRVCCWNVVIRFICKMAVTMSSGTDGSFCPNCQRPMRRMLATLSNYVRCACCCRSWHYFIRQHVFGSLSNATVCWEATNVHCHRVFQCANHDTSFITMTESELVPFSLIKSVQVNS